MHARVLGLVVLGWAAMPASAWAQDAVKRSIRTDPCVENRDALANEPFVMVTLPPAGARVQSGFVVRGCSRTFESHVQWRLTVRGGRALASGHTMGGGVDGPGPFTFQVSATVSKPTLAYLEVIEPSASDEGPASVRVIVPVVVRP